MPAASRELTSWTGAMIPIEVTLEWDHAQIHQGNGYTLSGKHVGLASTATLDFLLVTDGSTPHFRSAVMQMTGGPCDVALYEDTVTSADGTPMTPYNNNRLSTNTSSTLLYQGPTITDIGTQIEYHLVPVAGNQSGGAVEKVGGEWILKPASKYVVRVTNNDNSAVDVGFSFFWYEL